MVEWVAQKEDDCRDAKQATVSILLEDISVEPNSTLSLLIELTLCVSIFRIGREFGHRFLVILWDGYELA
jgi:hypothetical protein